VAKSKSTKTANQPAKPASNAKGSTSKGSAKKQVKVKKERGTVLSILLALVFLHSVFATLLAYSSLKEEYVRSITWVLPVLALVSLAGIVAAVGMWYWKKWGIYLYVGASVVAMVIHIIMTGSTWVVFYDLLPVAILGYVINLQSKRDLFV
jgi:hypothetical protein